jgi:uncharacterized protein (TIGR03435 family)
MLIFEDRTLFKCATAGESVKRMNTCQSLPCRAFGLILWSGIAFSATAKAQSVDHPVASSTGQAAVAPVFDVATVKPTKAESRSASGLDTSHGMLDAENVTLKRCIMGAYGIGPQQVIGGPDWLDSERFDIVAKSDEPVSEDAVMMTMLQALLSDRFKLVLHRETRMMPAYVLEVDKNGARLQQAKGGDPSNHTSTGRAGRVTIDNANTGMDLFTEILARKMDLPVINETGLKGTFDFKLHWTPDNVAPENLGPDDVSIFTALQEQLGLRLSSKKAPVEVLVIDCAERPSEN